MNVKFKTEGEMRFDMQPTRVKLELFLRGISQTQVAEKAGVDIAFVNRCVNGKQRPSKKVTSAMKELTGLDLFEDEKER